MGSNFFRILAASTGILLLLVLFDYGVEVVVNRSGILADAVDLQSGASLYSKIIYLKNVQGPSVAVIGDSTVVGAEMEEAGEPDWRAHTIDEVIKRNLKEPATVVNLGLNGAVVTDLERLVRTAVAAQPELLLISLDLGSFSMIDAKNDNFSRSWVRSFEMSPDGELHDSLAAKQSFVGRVNDSVDAFLNRYSFIYRTRNFMQWRFLEGPPAEIVRKSVRHLVNFLRGEGMCDRRVKLSAAALRLTRHYDAIDLSENNPQVVALHSLLKFLKDSGQKTIIFYVPPNPDQRFQLESQARYVQQWARIKGLLSSASSPNLTFIRDPKAPPPSEYNDDIHFTEQGYEDFVRANLAQVLATEKLTKTQ